MSSTSRKGSGSRPPRNSRSKDLDKSGQMNNKERANSNINDDDDSVVCGICSKTFTENTDKLLQCERCSTWFCTPCIKVSDEEYCVMARPDCHWFCKECSKPALQAVLNEKLVEDKCNEFLGLFEARLAAVEKVVELKASKADFHKIDMRVGALEEKVNTMSSSQSELQEKVQQTTSLAATEGVKELEDRESRKENLIVFGVEESKSEDSAERKEEDIKRIMDICKRGLDVKVNIRNVRRLGSGKRGSEDSGSGRAKPRPMLATLESQQQVTDALKSSRKLREHEDSCFHSVSLKKDMTPLERDRMRNLVQLRNQKREEAKTKGDDAWWVIRGDKVINIARTKATPSLASTVVSPSPGDKENQDRTK